MCKYTFVTLREKPEWKEQAAVWFKAMMNQI